MSIEVTQVEGIRHSLAHLLAATVIEMYPGAKNAIGPAIENGFYQDFDIPVSVTEDDLPKIEAKMREKLKTWVEFQRREVTAEEAKKQFSWNPYKLELIEDFERAGDKQITFYTSGDFIDLCKGGHVEDARIINPDAFKLTKVSGAYWRGDQSRQQLQRIYGVAFETKAELQQYLEMVEQAKLRDHRKLGQELDLFTTSPLVGKGLPLWTERGAKIRRLLERFILEEEERRGYRHVMTPDIANISLYKTSGHYPYYKDSMYSPIDIDGEKFMLRPMTCPHHFQLYLDKPRTYKELPMRIAELAKLYRYEQSGELSGLIRVRSFTLADSHIICTPDQALEEAGGALDLIEYCATVFGLEKGKDYQYRLSLGDRSDDSKYYKDDTAWEEAETVLREVLTSRNEPFYEAEAEAAFYGPKIDVQMKNVLGKEDTAFTVQYDFVMPKRFRLSYKDQNSEEREAIVIHRSSIGAIERVFAFLTEFYAGWFPLWLAPEQVRILTINDTVLDYVKEIETVLQQTVFMEPLRYNELRFTRDDRNESLGKKIREATALKIPIQLIVGPKDKEAREVSVRTRTGEEKMPLDKLAEYIKGV